MNATAETKRRGRPKDKPPMADSITDEQKKELEETRLILDQIKRAADLADPEIDGLTAEDVLRGANPEQNVKKYHKLLSKGMIVNDENANDQIESNAVANIKSLKKEAKAISKAIRGGKLPDEELAKLEARLPRIDKAIEKEKTRAAELNRRLDN